MLQIQDVRGCSCSVLPQTLGNEGYAVYTAFPQGKKHVNFTKILEFTRGRFQIFKSNFPETVRFLSFMPLWHDFYATMGLIQFHMEYRYSGQTPGTLHHVIVRGIEKKEIVTDNIDRKNFITRLGTLVTDTDMEVYA